MYLVGSHTSNTSVCHANTWLSPPERQRNDGLLTLTAWQSLWIASNEPSEDGVGGAGMSYSSAVWNFESLYCILWLLQLTCWGLKVPDIRLPIVPVLWCLRKPSHEIKGLDHTLVDIFNAVHLQDDHDWEAKVWQAGGNQLNKSQRGGEFLTWTGGPWCCGSWWGSARPASPGCESSPSRSRPSCGRSPADPVAAAPGARTAGPGTLTAPAAGHGSLAGREREREKWDKNTVYGIWRIQYKTAQK